MIVIYRVDKVTGEVIAFLPEERVKYVGNIKCYRTAGECEEQLRYFIVGTRPAVGVDLSVISRLIKEKYGEVEVADTLTNEMRARLMDELCDIKYLTDCK